jgi:hypothetical protein
MDYYTAAISLMFVALFETIAIVWCYGTKAGREPNSQIHFRLTGQIFEIVLNMVTKVTMS